MGELTAVNIAPEMKYNSEAFARETRTPGVGRSSSSIDPCVYKRQHSSKSLYQERYLQFTLRNADSIVSGVRFLSNFLTGNFRWRLLIYNEILHLAESFYSLLLYPIHKCITSRYVVNQANDLAGGPDLFL